MSVFSPHKSKRTKYEVGVDFYEMNTQVLPVYVDSGEEIDGKKIGIIEPQVISDRVDIQKYINSFAKDCGVENILKRFKATGDLSLFRQQPVIDGVDATSIPKRSVEEIYKDVPAELKGQKTAEQFLKSLTNEQLIQFAETLAAKAAAAKEASTEVKVNE